MKSNQEISIQMVKNIAEKGASSITSEHTIRKVKYENGKIISDEMETSNKKIIPLSNCPNCGANVEHDSNGKCHYCNTAFNSYQIKK